PERAAAIPGGTAVRLVVAGDAAQQRALPPAVRPDQPGTLAVAHDEARSLQDVAGPKRFPKFVGEEHLSSVTGIAPTAQPRGGILCDRSLFIRAIYRIPNPEAGARRRR